MAEKNAALVVLSGGQDSATCLLWALRKFREVQAITFDYGQRHRIELELARLLALRFGISHQVVELNFLKNFSSNALSNHSLSIDTSGGPNGLPNTFVPGRNALFLTVAASYAVPRNITHLVTGVCESDYSGYPDCREDFIRSIEKSLSLAMDISLTIHTPLMHLKKSETFALAHELGGLDLILEDTNTCYEGRRTERHEWGYGCGICPACLLRARGFSEWRGHHGNC